MSGASQQPINATAPARPSRLRRWGLRLAAATIVPALLLGSAELALRVAGVGCSTWFFAKAPGAPDQVMPNPKFGWHYFPSRIARRPEPCVLPRTKPPATLRVFVIGSSAAQGFPEPAFGMPRILEAMLRESFPRTNVEVVNAAMVAINSHVCVDIASDCASLHPDLLVVYEGNNEVIGPWGPGTAFARFTPSRAAIRASLAVKRLRLAQTIDDLWRSVAGGRAGSGIREWTGMELFLDSKIAADDPRLAHTAQHFRANLRAICDAGAAAGARVVLCTVGVNLRDCPPFASLHSPHLGAEALRSFDDLLQSARLDQQAGRPADALATLSQALAIDDRSADLHFCIGQALMALDRDGEALAAFARARDLDALRFRCDSTLSAMIREVARERSAGTTLVDVEALMRSPSVSAHGVPGSEMFLEHCHMTFAGNYLIARAVYEAAAPSLPGAGPGAGAALPTAPTPERCAELLGYSPLQRAGVASAIATLMERPPFTFQFGHDAMLAAARQQAADLKAAAGSSGLAPWLPRYAHEVGRWPRDWTLHREFAAALGATGDLQGAEREVRAVLGLLPFDVDAANLLAGLLLKRGDTDGAVRQYLAAMDSPWSNHRHRVETLFSIGVAEERRSRPDDAAARYQAALRIEPRNIKALTNLGLLWLHQSKPAQAEVVLRIAVQADPASPSAHLNLALVLQSLHRLDEATGELEQAVKLAPASAELRVGLGQAYLAARRAADAAAQFTEALRIKPDLAAAKAGLDATTRAGR